MRKFLFGLWIVPALLGHVFADSTMNITLSPLNSCATATDLKVGDFCAFEMVIRVPSSNTTMMHVELFTSDNSSIMIAQLCKPTITIGSNYNIDKAPIPVLSSSLENFQFDQAVIDFGTITNSGDSITDEDNSIKITFNVVVIENTEPDGSQLWITAGAEYYEGNEIWIGQTSYTYRTDTDPSNGNPSPSFEAASSSADTEIGKFGTFESKLKIEGHRIVNLSLSAASNDIINNAVTVCSIHIKSAGWCFGCLDTTKAYIRSVYSKERNVATLSLGKIVNIGINTLNQTGNSDIDIFVAYRVSHLAKESDTSEITLTASINGADTSFVYTVTVAAAESQIIAPVPNVTTVGINNPVSFFQAFNITMIINFPQDYNNFMEVESVPVHDTVDGLPRAKVCSAVVTSSGENMPCPKCMNKAKLNSFSLNSSLYSIHDGMTWSLGSVLNFNLRTTNDNPEVNTITISVVGQILDHPSNVQGANISIPIGITFGNQTIWVSDNSIIIDNGPNYSLANESLPTFSISTADNGAYAAKIKEPRAIYFDMYTKPGSVYQEMDIEVLMPETLLGSNTPAATVCTVTLHYVGIYSTCAQQLYINEPSNNHISYLQKMIKFKNDKAIVNLPALCNSAESGFNMDPIDGLVRFLIYFQLDDHPEVPSENYISVGTRFTTDQIYIGSINFTKSDTLPMVAATGVHSFSNLTLITTSGSTFSPANFFVKIPPNSLFGYNLEARLITNSLSEGRVTLCTIRILEQGNNVPCSNQLKHSFQYSEQLIRNYDFAIAGPICSINNISNSVNNADVWDEDSVNFQILTRTSHDAAGSYSVNLALMDQFSNTSLKTESFTFTLNPSTVVLDTPDLQWTKSSIFGVDPTDSTYVFVNSDYLNFFKGQTSIIRFNLTIDEPKSFETTFSLSNTQADELEIIRFFTLYIGENFPCSSMLSEATYFNGSKYPYEIKINVGELSFFETDPNNITSSTIYLEAQVRIPISSPISPEATTNFVLKPMLNNIEYPSLTQTLTVTVKDPTDLVSNVSELYSFTEQPGQQVSIRQSLKLNISLKIPPYSNCRTKIIFSCVDKTSGRQFCQINSTRIVSFGKNVDGLKNEYLNNLILTEFNRSAMTFYNDMTILDLGIVTNTHYSQKINSYEPDDDFLHFEADILVTDDQIAEQNSQFNFTAKLDLNSGQQSFDSHQTLSIQRTQTERPYVAVNVNFLNDTSLIINSNSKLSVKFEIEHEINSNAEAYNVRFLFYLPTYISFSGENNCSFNPSLNESLITLALDRLHFGQKASCHFSIIFDQSNQYSSLMDQYGKSPLSLKIPYVVFYEKYARSGDQETKFNTNFSFIEFKPPSISITSVPMNKLKNTLSDVACRMTSSVPEVVNVYNSGWKFGYRSHHWLKYLGSYVTISFVDQAKVSRIDFNQFNDDGTVTAFNEFRIAYSDDNSTFAHLPSIKTSTQLGQNFSYEIPNKFVQCRYLRIYITDVANRADLETKKTGFAINEIYGDFTPTTTVSCPDSKVSIDYAPRSFLYVDWTQNIYVCDETTDRSSSECYSSSNSAPTNWMVLSKIVSTVVFYIKELSSGREFLYGISKDKTGFVRSDDGGIVWKIVSPREFNEMKINANGNIMYQSKFYQKLSLVSPNLVSEGSWTFSANGVLNGGTLKFDWFN